MAPVPVFWVRCPKRRAGYNIGASRPVLVRLWFPRVATLSPCAVRLYRILRGFLLSCVLHDSSNFMFVWTIKPLFFFAAHLHPISFKVSLCVIVSPLIQTQLPITSNTRPDKPERTFNTFPCHHRNYIEHVHQYSGTDLFYQYLPSIHQKLHLPLSSVQP